MSEISAPAKINLTLEVLGERQDGYHDIRSVVQAIDLCDTISFEDSNNVIIGCDMPGWSADKSLVPKAVALVRESFRTANGIKLDIKKRIPLMSGLGGDSSDAAAVIRGLNESWELKLLPETLNELAASLGSDVFYFFHGGTALVEGRGEVVKPLPPLPQMWAVIIIPDVPGEAGKTARMYRGLSEYHYTGGKITEKLLDMIEGRGEFDASLLFNTFENVAFQDKILLDYKEHLVKLGAPHVHLCGSGPALFTLFVDKIPAEELYTRCRNQGMEVFLAATL
jgi:4-diphosphocytidyl-2-C-methyl-D-erythritol kinase